MFSSDLLDYMKQAEGEMPQGIDPAAIGGGEHSDEAAMADSMGGGEGGEGDEVQQLAQIAAQLGITPEDLQAAMASEAGGHEGGESEHATADEAPGMEVEAALKAAADALAAAREKKEKEQEETKAKEAAAKKGNAKQASRDWVQEVIARSRR